MNAPGNSILIIALVAVFVACCGYAAGRVHQRRQTGGDREAAYRDGYEKGSHSVFRLAARALAPRRPARAVAAVKPESEAGDETTLLPPMPAPEKTDVPVAEMAELGFPLPPPPPLGTVPEPPAVGGVRFQRFPDPRTGGATTVLPDMSDQAAARTEKAAVRTEKAARPEKADSVPEPRRPPGHRAPEDEEDTVNVSAEESSPGRHTVPEELVQAATYRLPPDRVFRAKVRDTPTPPSDEPTTKLVPKPRQS
jgi:hypothetical protein